MALGVLAWFVLYGQASPPIVGSRSTSTRRASAHALVDEEADFTMPWVNQAEAEEVIPTISLRQSHHDARPKAAKGTADSSVSRASSVVVSGGDVAADDGDGSSSKTVVGRPRAGGPPPPPPPPPSPPPSPLSPPPVPQEEEIEEEVPEEEPEKEVLEEEGRADATQVESVGVGRCELTHRLTHELERCTVSNS